MKYTVKRQHFGDRLYLPDEERELNENDARNLVNLGVLEPVKQKKAPEPENKQAPKPENKASKSPKNK